MSKGDFINLDENTELMKITNDKYRYVNPLFSKPSAKLSDFNADIKIKVGNEYFKAHKDVLSSGSDYFSAMFSHDMLEKGKDYIELRDISLGGFQIMLEYFYHGHITLELENVQHCLEASRFFHVEWLTKVCCNYMMRHLSVENCLHILGLVDAYSLMDLIEEMYCFLGLNAGRLMESGKLHQLPYDVLLTLLSADYYIDLPEEMVLGMLIEWVNSDFKVRECKLLELVSHIKFHLFSPEELDNIPAQLLAIGDIRARVHKSRLVWEKPHKWSILDEDISARGGREVMMLLTDWTSDKMQMVDLNNPYLHVEPFGLLNFNSLSDFVTVVPLGGFLYGLGGYDTSLNPHSYAVMFDPRLRYWIELSPMKHRRQSFPAVSMDNKLYVLGGATLLSAESADSTEECVEGVSGSLSQCECYDPKTDTWSCIPSLPYGLASHQACVHNGTIYVTGGVCESRSEPVPIGHCYSWTPGDQSWSRKASMLHRKQRHAMFTYNNKIYTLGGYTAGDLEDLNLGLGLTNCLKNECYNPETDTWEELIDTPVEFGEIGQAAAVMDGVAYILGGTSSHKYLHEFHLDTGEFVEGAYCGKNFVQLTKLRMYYPRIMPNDLSNQDKDSDSGSHLEEINFGEQTSE